MPETIYDALRESHALQRSLCRKLLRSQPHDARRGELFRELRIELAAHEAAEERYLYVPMLMDDMGLNSSRHALHEHHELDELILALNRSMGLTDLYPFVIAPTVLEKMKFIHGVVASYQSQ